LTLGLGRLGSQKVSKGVTVAVGHGGADDGADVWIYGDVPFTK